MDRKLVLILSVWVLVLRASAAVAQVGLVGEVGESEVFSGDSGDRR